METPNLLKPYIKKDSPLRAEHRPGIVHAKGMLKVDRHGQKDEVTATRRALRKAARREGKREIDDAD